MARFSNPFYQDPNTVPPDPVFDIGPPPVQRAQQVRYRDPTEAIGSNLVTALFGDPAMAAKQRQMQAEAAARDAAAEEARAHAAVYQRQATGLDATNAANSSLGDLFAALGRTSAGTPARAPMGTESDDAGEIPGTPGVTADQAFKTGLPAVIAAMVQGGHGSDIDNAVRAAAAFGGGDEMARRGLVAGGSTPGKDFAITPDRADAIAKTAASASLAQALGVATINNRDNVPVANIRATADRDVAGIAAGSRAQVADIRTGGASSDAYTGGWTPRARNGGDNSDAAVDGKIAGVSRALGVAPGADISRLAPLAIAQALSLSEGGPGSIADKNNNPANIKTPDGKSFMVYPTKAAGLAAAAALVQRKLASGQTTIQSMIEGLPTGGGAAMSSDAIDRAAQTYNLTGKLPTSLGRGGVIQQRILSRAAQLASGTGVGDQAASQAGRASDVKSLAQLQKQYDAMSAFERTTVANGRAAIDKAITAGGPSTFSLWNSWVQAGRRATTNPNVRALDVAISTLASEYGKAIGGGANGNAALTDSARKEASAMFSSSMNVRELKAAVGQATVDMRNRRLAYGQQLAEIRGRIAGNGSPQPAATRQPPPGATKTATGPNGQKIALVGGQWKAY